MRILAVDQSLTESGYWLDDTINGTFKTDSKKYNQFERILQIRSSIQKLYDLYDFKILVMEGYSYGSPNRAVLAGEVAGMIKVWCHDQKIKVIIVPPTLVKKFVCDKGNAKKEQMLLQIYKRFNKEFDNNNLADAFALWKFYDRYVVWESQPNNPIFKKYEIECFKTFKKSQQERLD